MHLDNAPASPQSGHLLAHVFGHRKALSASILSQVVSSGTNFTLALVLVRVLSEADYGSFCLGIAVCYLYAGVGNSMLLLQMVVHTPDKPHEERLPYAVRILVAVVLFAAGTVVLTALGSYLVSGLWPGANAQMTFAIAVATASGCYLVKDYFVREAFVARVEPRALAITCSVALSLAALLALAWLCDISMTPERALIVFAASQVAGATTGFTLARLPLQSFRSSAMLADLSGCWRGGLWLTSVSVTGWAKSEAYVYLTFIVLGAADTGRANAARLLISPFLLISPAINAITTPRFADMRTRDPRGMVRGGTAITAALLGLALLYSTILLMTSESLVPAILGPQYRNMRGPLAAWCVTLFAILARDGATPVFVAMKRFRALASVNAATAAVSVVSVLGLMRVWGVTGAILGGAVGDLTQAALLWGSLHHGADSVPRPAHHVSLEQALPDGGSPTHR